MDVAVQLLLEGLYRAPVLTGWAPLNPPQTIISVPDQTAVWPFRAVGGLVVLVAVHELLVGL